jgi:GNAT superfamily N-acetyltransferase
MTDLVVRPLADGEEHLFDAMPDTAPDGVFQPDGSYRDLVALRQYRPEWTWIALRDGVVVARAVWWSAPDDAEPMALDRFDFADADTGAALLRAAPFRTEYDLRLAPDWRDRPAVAAWVASQVDVLATIGVTPLVERHTYRWTVHNGLPERPGRLRFRTEPDDERFLDVLRRVAVGTLDAHTRRAIAADGIEAAAREDLDFLRWFPSPRDWWRLAETPDGRLVGLTVPARNQTDPVIGLIGVVPEQRGHGYGYDLLVEATHLLVETGAEHIIAATDVPNTPMAGSFARAGYPVIRHRFDLVSQP